MGLRQRRKQGDILGDDGKQITPYLSMEYILAPARRLFASKRSMGLFVVN